MVQSVKYEIGVGGYGRATIEMLVKNDDVEIKDFLFKTDTYEHENNTLKSEIKDVLIDNSYSSENLISQLFGSPLTRNISILDSCFSKSAGEMLSGLKRLQDSCEEAMKSFCKLTESIKTLKEIKDYNNFFEDFKSIGIDPVNAHKAVEAAKIISSLSGMTIKESCEGLKQAIRITE